VIISALMMLGIAQWASVLTLVCSHAIIDGYDVRWHWG